VDEGTCEETTMRERLTREEEQAAVADFVDYRHPDGAPEGFLEGCEVSYYQDDDGRWRYQVTDATGHGDGTGEWHPVGEAGYARRGARPAGGG
jgi:hypothetical protein